MAPSQGMSSSLAVQHGMTLKKLETPEKPHICGIKHCGISYFYMQGLRRHQRSCHHGNLGSPEAEKWHLGEEQQDFSDPNHALRFPCNFPGCLWSYGHQSSLDRHKNCTTMLLPQAEHANKSQAKKMSRKCMMIDG